MFNVRRRECITLIGGTIGWPLAATAQQLARVPRIGIVDDAPAWHPSARRYASSATSKASASTTNTATARACPTASRPRWASSSAARST